ncbi:MAG TPA: S8 family serine peptidase [Vicinamibacterales bacterium]|nr:S8 family serine peptidase [Vicinamibacterales bacterium]
MPIATNRVLVKMRPSNALEAAESRANLRPLYDGPQAMTARGFGLDSTPQWFIAELSDGGDTPWDLAHGRVADQLGVADSDVIFAEPDIIHDVYEDTNEERTAEGFGATTIECVQNPQDQTRGKPVGPNEVWHLGPDFTQLSDARDAVAFSDPRTRIAHIDTGYYPSHVTRPLHLRTDLERNFVDGDGNPNSAVDPNNERRILDNSGHGTGTLSILAGRAFAPFNVVLGGAPDADIVPLRVADSVVLLRTSALARALAYAVEQDCDVITMSMGGLPTRAWAEAVDRLYEAGIVFCAAGGNRTRPLPPSVLVYPARYPRVIAVVGAMFNGQAYKNLDRALEGCFGPDAAMKTALAAYTPNIPWARFGCDDIVRLNGEGTSSATPQVAAAAALWIEKYKKLLPRNWRRVEAVRKALFDSALAADRDHFGNGVLRARAALEVKPDLDRRMSDKSNNSFAFLRLITGLGITEPTPREEMFNLELAQRWLRNPRLQELVPDPEELTRLQDDKLRQVMEAVIEDHAASVALRRHVAARYPAGAGGAPAPHNKNSRGIVPDVLAACDVQPQLRNPSHRRLRVYAVDPNFSTRLATASMNEVTLKVPWDPAYKNGAGEYLKFDDVDPTGKRYQPVDLNAPSLLAQDGWAPAEGNAQFHQQMVYAVAMKTIAHFEKALGRPVLWRPRPNPDNDFDDKAFVRQLTVRPHALRQANAFYSPNEVALKFGYFEASADHPGEHMPGSRIYACLSHDIIAHETTHAILDGMHRRFNEATNPDVLAFHEAFADIVALMQHFTIPEVLESEIARTRGDIESESMLGMLAVQFGQATGGRGALRNAIGQLDNGVWTRNQPDPAELQKRVTPHARGAILVAAVFDAFIAIYKMRVADLLRIYTGGTGVLRAGAIHPDLVKRLAGEATKAADHVLEMCIRALDYLPPIDVTFFEYLRALITADYDVAGAGHEYRVAFVEAFRRRGIYPQTLDAAGPETPRTLSVDTLRWTGGIDLSAFTDKERKAIVERYGVMIENMREYAKEVMYIEDRETLFKKTRKRRAELNVKLKAAFKAVPAFARQLGLEFGDGFDPAEDRFEVHSLRSSMRVTKDGRYIPQVVVVLTQARNISGVSAAGGHLPMFRGGSTLVVDLTTADAIKYRIIKNIDSSSRLRSTTAFVQSAMADPLRALLVAPAGNEHFLALHSLADEGV